MLLEFNPGLAKYSTFHGLNFPLHFTSAKSHNEIMTLLLENGVDVNLRNYCGQTTLMQAYHHSHWEVVQTLLIYRSIICIVPCALLALAIYLEVVLVLPYTRSTTNAEYKEI
ncbi:E3 ubiquitin-protein ligase XBAT33-like isoform X3 [Zingiber officinale]|uniref:E3 ubiquitin-protein ligase XBAT33-like isoform X3 n=1 Tax=Zingiber officinale TaxID=94328 RepID=UPI001C4B1042|nr:E3 ubiquitin-protein ligase XBAT33-like isoform X3 [Zingiber officinale]